MTPNDRGLEAKATLQTCIDCLPTSGGLVAMRWSSSGKHLFWSDFVDHLWHAATIVLKVTHEIAGRVTAASALVCLLPAYGTHLYVCLRYGGRSDRCRPLKSPDPTFVHLSTLHDCYKSYRGDEIMEITYLDILRTLETSILIELYGIIVEIYLGSPNNSICSEYAELHCRRAYCEHASRLHAKYWIYSFVYFLPSP